MYAYVHISLLQDACGKKCNVPSLDALNFRTQRTARFCTLACIRAHASAGDAMKGSSMKDDVTICESLVEIVRESSRGTLDLRFAGYRCRTSKEESSPSLFLSSWQKHCVEPHSGLISSSLCFSSSISFFFLSAVSISRRHENVIRPRLRFRWPSAGLKRGMPRMRIGIDTKATGAAPYWKSPLSIKYRWPNSRKSES